jgi:GNAT superfamily N-acetyltransferase
MSDVQVRPIAAGDRAAWAPLWDGYNAFYGREGPTALAPEITQALWHRLFDPTETVFALVAVDADRLVGLAHYLFHRSTTRIEPVCYLQDLFTAPELRGRGVGRALIEAVYARARDAGAKRVYWQTRADNAPARRLYDQLARHHGFVVYAHDA